MADRVEFAVDGTTAGGVLVVPASGSGPGVVVVQEWWGLDPGILEMAERLGRAGFVALVPDLYHGEVCGHTEMDKAAHLMATLPPERAAADMSAAVDYLVAHPAVTGDGIGVVGFCMGGMLTWILAARRGDVVRAAVPFYGFPQGDDQPDWSGLTAVVQGHMAEHDDFFPPDAARDLETRLRASGHDVTITVHPGSGHAFMNPFNPLGTLDEALGGRIWPEVCAFLHAQLG
ncbi:MAG: dienelactone hydrolase family protein [Actinomycetota bacterium]